MSVTPNIGHGTLFKRGNADGPPETFTTIAGVTSITPPALSKDTVDVTNMQSSDRFREHISGLRDAGEASIEINFDPDSTEVANLITDYEADSARTYQILFESGADWTFEGIVTGMTPAIPVDDKMTATVSLKVTGKPVLTAA